MYNYDTVTDAINGLRERGFTLDFNLQVNSLQCFNPDLNLTPHEFEIKEIYRFEGDTNPSDEEIVYAIESKDGHKGVFVNGYGTSAEAVGGEMMKKLVDHHNQ
ncbi:phosphoribosylpyrophosphate synthetase [Lacibacter luteus]|uniref:Phosphoribosylpyrophosphate synthetase n=1 Tax=Lacibacter luteus TaxID=2508719 RepID=A0A4Q1CLQ7_9BACT|nr:phosphoribosylpyrophosphate synthetase [Lacibacter luteus]RXK61920.1 phosphoribosylpyrophosphate synthetase [Lacibacter luteus]